MELTLDAGKSLGDAVCFAAKVPPAQPTVLGAVLLTVLLVVAAVVAWWHWREAHEEEATDSPDDLLASFEEAYEAGEIDEAEIKRLRAKLSGTSAAFLTKKPPRNDPSSGRGA